MVELKDELATIKKSTKELNFRAMKTLEYLNEFVTEKKLKELKDKIVKLDIPRLKDEYICKILDTLPRSVDDLKTVLQGYTVTVNNDNMKKVIDVVNSTLK